MSTSEAYNILGLNPGATEEEIKVAYRVLAKKYAGEAYTVSPMKEEAEACMAQLDTAFDTLMGEIRTGRTTSSTSASGKYTEIRNLINSGGSDEALAQLKSIDDNGDAEWNFLMGSVYYYKGHLNKALTYFDIACRKDPENAEYGAAYNHLKSSQGGNMQGNPYDMPNPYEGGMACSPCTICNTLICADCLCGCMRGC
ncbi:MAG: DnaJ domain-containing protein [Oscillospiraceae bacterium]|nr:DnaJ domain-containing protein [Oscillospiraceae bacterium]